MAAIEAEVDGFVAAHSGLVDGQGRRRVVRNGHAPERQLQTGIGPIAVRRPKVRDRGPDGSARIRFTSAVLPAYLRRTKNVEELLPWLYLKGISTGQFEEALACGSRATIDPATRSSRRCGSRSTTNSARSTAPGRAAANRQAGRTGGDHQLPLARGPAREACLPRRRGMEPVTKKPVEAADEEIARNPRSRSAKLRVAVRRRGSRMTEAISADLAKAMRQAPSPLAVPRQAGRQARAPKPADDEPAECANTPPRAAAGAKTFLAGSRPASRRNS